MCDEVVTRLVVDVADEDGEISCLVVSNDDGRRLINEIE